MRIIFVYIVGVALMLACASYCYDYSHIGAASDALTTVQLTSGLASGHELTDADYEYMRARRAEAEQRALPRYYGSIAAGAFGLLLFSLALIGATLNDAIEKKR